MTFTEGMKSTGKDECPTPQYVFNYLDRKYHFDLDVCSTHENAKCKNHYTKEDDGLKQPWFGVVFMNPPYNRLVIGLWLKKAVEYANGGGIVVAVLPARTDNQWWNTYVIQATEIWFVVGRISFEGYENGAKFPTAIAIFGTQKYPRISNIAIVDPNKTVKRKKKKVVE